MQMRPTPATMAQQLLVGKTAQSHPGSPQTVQKHKIIILQQCTLHNLADNPHTCNTP